MIKSPLLLRRRPAAGGAPSYGDPEYPTVTLTGITSYTGVGTVGIQFNPDVAGRVTGIRWYHLAFGDGIDNVYLFSSGGSTLASVAATFTSATSEWRSDYFASPVTVSASTNYYACASYSTSDDVPFVAASPSASTNVSVGTNGWYHTNANTAPDTEDVGYCYYAVPIFEPEV